MRQAMVPEGRIPCPHQVAAVFFTDAPKAISFVQAVDATAVSKQTSQVAAVLLTSAARENRGCVHLGSC
jgi:hypothetical protein